ncbi:VAB-10B protein [Dirofilaria immitis]|nr:VAB-10B protein [Dirofilaria immitis]
MSKVIIIIISNNNSSRTSNNNNCNNNGQVYGLEQRRQAYLSRLRTQFVTRLGIRTEQLMRENEQRRETIRRTTFVRVEDCIQWVRSRLVRKLSEMEFIEDLEQLESMFEEHKIDNHEIQDFRRSVDECIMRQAEISAEDTHEYCELLSILESEYQQLRDLSAGRMLDLDTLIAFIRGAQHEIVWINEREDIEVSRNWSDIKQLDLPMLQNYYKQLLHEIELREPRFNDVHNKGAALLNQGHPAIHVIEFYLNAMQRKWDWLLALSKCLEQHLRDALNLNSFMEDASAAEDWMIKQSDMLGRKYNRSEFSLEEGEQMLRELDEISELIKNIILPNFTLWQRGERIQRPIPVVALADYTDKDITIREGDECILVDNSDLIHWKIREPGGAEVLIPSVVFRILPPDSRITTYLNRLHTSLEKLHRLWAQKHRMVRYNMVLNTMAQIRNWNLNTFAAMTPEERDAIMKALNDDAHKLLSELEPNDPLAMRLKEELRLTNEHFYDLLNQMNRPKEPEVGAQFDAKIAELLVKLDEAYRNLNDRVMQNIPKSREELERLTIGHKDFEDGLQALDVDVSAVNELFRQIPEPSPSQRANFDHLSGRWEDLWELSRMYVERLKSLEAVLNGLIEVTDIVRRHEIMLNSFDDMPASLDKLRGVHSQLLELNMVLQQQQTIIDALNHNIAILRQHVSRTRQSPNHPDVDRLEDEVQTLTVRWENVCSQVVDRLKTAEHALQTQIVYRTEYENEIKWLDNVEATINSLRKPEELRPEQYQQQLDQLIAEYSQLQERTEAVENVNREGGKFIREAKGYDNRLMQYMENIINIHGPVIRNSFRRSTPQPKSGTQQVTEELEHLNRRFAQLSSLILERRNIMQILIQNWKRKKQLAYLINNNSSSNSSRITVVKTLIDQNSGLLQFFLDLRNPFMSALHKHIVLLYAARRKRRQFEAARLKALEDADRLRKQRKAAEDARRAAEEADRLRREREAEDARRRAEEARRRMEEDARRRAAEDEARRKAEEDARREMEEAERERERRRREMEDAERRRREMEDAERRRREMEDAERRRREMEDAERERERLRREEDEFRRRKQAEEDAERERKRKEDRDRRRREEEEQERRRREDELRRQLEDEARERERKRLDDERRRAEEERRRRDEDERRLREEKERLEKEQRRPKIPSLSHGMQQAIVSEGGELQEFEEIRDVPERATIAEHEDEMQMYQEETITKTQFYEMEGILHKQTGEILTFVEAIRQGLLDLHSGGGNSMTSYQKAAELGYIDGGFHEVLNTHYGVRHPETGESLSLLEAIQIGLYDPDIRQLRDIETGEILPMYDCISRGITTLDTQHRLVKMGVLKLPPMSLENAIEQGVVNKETGYFTGKYTRETMPLKDALYNGYIQIGGCRPHTMIAITLSDCLETGLINGYTGEFVDKYSGEKITLREAVSKQYALLNLHVPEIVKTDENRRITLGEAIVRNVVNTRQGNFSDPLKSQNLTLQEAFSKDLIQKPLTLTEINQKDLIDSTNKFIDGGTKNRFTLLEAIAAGLLDPDVRHIVDPDEKDVISIAEALERGLLEPDAVNDGLLIKRVRHSIFNVKGIKNTKTEENLTFNEAVDCGVIILQAERIVDLATNQSFLITDCVDKDLLDPMLFEFLTTLLGIKNGSKEDMTVIRAVAKGFIDPQKGIYVDKQTNRELSPKQAYDDGLLTLKGALQLSAMLDIHPSLVTPVKKIDHKNELDGQDKYKVTLAEAMKQGLIDSRTHRFRQGDTEMSFEEALSQGLIHPSDEWIIPSKSTGAGPTVEEKISESITETAQQLAPKYYPDKNIEETVTTIKKVRKTETTALGGPGGVSVYRAVTGSKDSFEVPTDGYHILDAERKGYVNLKTGTVSLPNLSRSLTLQEAFQMGILNSESITLLDPSTEAEAPVGTGSSKKKVIQFSPSSEAVISFRPIGTATVEETEQSWTFDSKRLTLDAALATGKIDREDLRVFDTLTAREMSFEEAEKWGVIDEKDHYYLDKRENKRYSLAQAALQHRVFPTGGVPENASDAIHTTYKIQKRKQTLVNALDSGWYDPKSGMFAHPQTQKQMSLKESIIKGLFNPYGTVVLDKRRMRELSLLEAIDENIINDTEGTILDTKTGKFVDLKTAHLQGLLRSKNLPQSLEGALVSGKLDLSTGRLTTSDGSGIKLEDAIATKLIDSQSIVFRDPSTGEELPYNTAVEKKIIDPIKGIVYTKNMTELLTFPQALTSGVLTGVGSRTHAPQKSQSTRIIERKLQLTPYAPEPAEKSTVAVMEQRTVGPGRKEIVDLGGGKQVMVKVVRGEGGVEKGEYIDPSSGMKFTIQLHGDPYMTEAKTVVKSTAQVQSIQLEPHAEFVGIDKIRDKRNGRVMSLQDAQRIGVIDARGEKLSLKDAIRAKLIDLQDLTYLNPKTGDALTLAQAANMGLIDVTLSETLPKGVCHPANGERISVQRAIELGIINPKTGEELAWLDIMKPVYASLTMEGVYDPTKGYGVPVLTALTEGLINANTGQYSNIITAETISLKDASNKGLIDAETYKAITEPFLIDYRTKRKLNLIEAVQNKLVDPKNKTIQFDEQIIMPVSRATSEGKIPLFVGEKLKRIDKMTFAEALSKGMIDVAQNRFTDSDLGRQMSINQAIEEGYIDTGNVEALEGSDERNLANILFTEEFDEISGRIRDKKSGLYLTFKSAVDRDVIDGDSLLHDLESSHTMTVKEALNQGTIDPDGKYIHQRMGIKITLKDALAKGLIALIASPMQAAQAVAEAVKRRDAEGYRFKLESVDERKIGNGTPRYREEIIIGKLSSPHRSEPGLSRRVRSISDASRGSRGKSLIDDPQAMADLQHEFLDNLRERGFDVEEKVIELPESVSRVSIREAAESGLLDIITGDIVHPASGRRYSIPRAVHMKMMTPDAARRMMETLNISVEDLGQTPLIESASVSPSESSIKMYTKTVSWRGKPSELRQISNPLAPYTTYASSSSSATIRTPDVFPQ